MKIIFVAILLLHSSWNRHRACGSYGRLLAWSCFTTCSSELEGKMHKFIRYYFCSMVIACILQCFLHHSISKRFKKSLKKFQEFAAQVYVFIMHTHLCTSIQVQARLITLRHFIFIVKCKLSLVVPWYINSWCFYRVIGMAPVFQRLHTAIQQINWYAVDKC